MKILLLFFFVPTTAPPTALFERSFADDIDRSNPDVRRDIGRTSLSVVAESLWGLVAPATSGIIAFLAIALLRRRDSRVQLVKSGTRERRCSRAVPSLLRPSAPSRKRHSTRQPISWSPRWVALHSMACKLSMHSSRPPGRTFPLLQRLAFDVSVARSTGAPGHC